MTVSVGSFDSLRPARKALFAVLTTVGFFVLVEVLLAIGGVEPVSATDDPFVGFASTSPLYVEEASTDGQVYMVTAPNKAGWFNKQRFLKDKAAGSYRIFTLGGSTTFGRPYDDRVSFGGWLREFLNEADPSREWEVINSGGVSYASYRVAKVMEELTRYEPDLFIIYSGHNEFLERRTYSRLIDAPSGLLAIGGLLSRTRVFSAGRRILRGRALSADRDGETPLLAAEVDTILARSAGPDDYHRDHRFREQAIAHYRFNMSRMADLARSVGARVILVNPAANLKDCSPFKSESSAALSAGEVARFAALVKQGMKAWKSGDAGAALDAFDQAAAIDDRYAQLHYQRGLVLAELERWDKADAAFRRALDEDVCPLRILPSMREALAQVASDKGVALIDFAEIIEKRSEHGIPGAEYFLDHVHLTVEGYRLLAIELMAALEREGVANVSQSWSGESLQRVTQRVERGLDNSAHGIALRNLARVFAWAGKTEEAGRLARRAVDSMGEDAESYHLLGRGAWSEGDRAGAIRYLRRAIEIRSDYADARTSLGGRLLELGEVEEAVGHLQEAVRLDPNASRAQGNLGLALASIGRVEEAIGHYQTALRLDPTSAQVHSNLAVSLTARGEIEEAIRHLEQALVLSPDYLDAHNNLGMALSSLGRRLEAADHFQRALQIDPEAAEVQFNLGVVLQQLGRLDSAVARYQESLRLEPSHAGARHNLAIAIESMAPREGAPRED